GSLSTLNTSIKDANKLATELNHSIIEKETIVENNLPNSIKKTLESINLLSIKDLYETEDKLSALDQKFKTEQNLSDDRKYEMLLEEGFSGKTKEVIEAVREVFSLAESINPKGVAGSKTISKALKESVPTINALLDPHVTAKLDLLSNMIQQIDQHSQ